MTVVGELKEQLVTLKPGDKCEVWEAYSYYRPAKILKTRKGMEAHRVRFLDTGEINTVSWYLTFPPGHAANPSPNAP